MRDMTNVDMAMLIKELPFENKRLDNIYDAPHGSFRLRVDKTDFMINFNPKAAYITKYELPSQESPSMFVSVLRKYLKGKFINKIYQQGLDRILIFDFGEFLLVFELFSKGNMILVSKSDNVTITAFRNEEWKDRVIKPKEVYSFPKSTKIEIADVNADKIFSLQSESHPIVNVLSSRVNIGSFYVEKILEIANIDKQKTKLTKEDAEKIANATKEFEKLLKGEKSKFELKNCFSDSYSFIEINGAAATATLSESIDALVTPLLLQNKADDEKLQKITAKLDMQKKSLEDFLLKEKEYREIGDFIYSHLTEVDSILKSTEKAGEAKIGMETIKWKKEGMKVILEA